MNRMATGTKQNSTFVLTYGVSHLGYFAVMPVLAVWLPQFMGNFLAACTMAAFGITVRAATLFLGKVLRSLPFALTMQCGLLLAAAAFLALAVQAPPFILMVALFLAGTGINLNGSSIRLYVTEKMPNEAKKLEVFSSINIAVNVSAGIGPVLGNLFFTVAPSTLFGFTAICYAAASFVPPILLKYKDRSRQSYARLSFFQRVIRPLVQPQAIWVTVAVFLGYVLYGQLFSSIALFVNDNYESPFVRGSIFAVNAISVIVLQPVAVRCVNFSKKRGVPNSVLLLLGSLLFTLALVLTLLNPFVGIILFSFAETLFIPQVDTAMLSLPFGGSLDAVQARQVVVALGEGAGLGIGVVVSPGWLAVIAALIIVGLLLWRYIGNARNDDHVFIRE